MFKNVGKKLDFLFMTIGYLAVIYCVLCVIAGLISILQTFDVISGLWITFAGVGIGFSVILLCFFMTGIARIVIYHENFMEDSEDSRMKKAFITAICIFLVIVLLAVVLSFAGFNREKSTELFSQNEETAITSSNTFGKNTEEILSFCFGTDSINTMEYIGIKESMSSKFDVFKDDEGYVYVERSYPYRVYLADSLNSEMFLIWKNGGAVN